MHHAVDRQAAAVVAAAAAVAAAAVVVAVVVAAAVVVVAAVVTGTPKARVSAVQTHITVHIMYSYRSAVQLAKHNYALYASTVQ
jgi:hypothetical protein